MAILGMLLAYLLGSISFGVLVGWWRGTELRTRDLPGASGVFRQLGAGWGILVGALDLLKGLGVAWLGIALGLEGWWWGVLGAAAVLGHSYPLFFGFRGGGGILTALGFVVVAIPVPLGVGAAVGLGLGAVYYWVYWRNHRSAIYPLPLAAALAVVVLLGWLAVQPQWIPQVFPAVLALMLRGLRLGSSG